MNTDRAAEITALRTAITAAEDQLAAGFAEQVSLHDQIGAARARIGALLGEAAAELAEDEYWAARFCGGDPR